MLTKTRLKDKLMSKLGLNPVAKGYAYEKVFEFCRLPQKAASIDAPLQGAHRFVSRYLYVARAAMK